LGSWARAEAEKIKKMQATQASILKTPMYFANLRDITSLAEDASFI
jgi:hypothetical protein